MKTRIAQLVVRYLVVLILWLAARFNLEWLQADAVLEVVILIVLPLDEFLHRRIARKE